MTKVNRVFDEYLGRLTANSILGKRRVQKHTAPSKKYFDDAHKPTETNVSNAN